MPEKGWVRQNLLHLVGRLVDAFTMKNTVERPSKPENGVIICSSSPIPRHISREEHDSKRHMQPKCS